MFSKIHPRHFFKTLSFRLTFSYSSVLVLVSLCGILSLYFCVKHYLQSRTDGDLREELYEYSYFVESQDIEEIQSIFDFEAESDGPDYIFFRLINAKNEVLAASDTSAWPVSVLNSFVPENRSYQSVQLHTIDLRDHENTARIITGVLPSGNVLQTGFLVDEEMELLANIRLYSAIILLCIMIAGIIVGRNISRIAVQGINDVTQTANNIAEGNIHNRVPVSKYGKELENLGNTFNRMTDKITTLLNEMKEINDNIAHDLRNPLARMRGLAEEKITQKNVSEDCFSICEDVIEECDILLHIINTMLDISEMESGMASLDMETFDLKIILSQAVESFLPVAEDKGVRFHSNLNDTVMVKGDRRKIQRSISNIIDNALKYTNQGGDISVKLLTGNSPARIVVTDTGIGISNSDKQKIFQRFYRGSKSRTLPGNGLGLSLALSVAHAHGGTITAESHESGGSEFTFSLPVH